MFISKFRINNFKSFHDSGEINFTQGINIITGQNNSGKTALLQALSIKFKSDPHRSSLTLPKPNINIDNTSKFDVEFSISKEEIEDIIFNKTNEIIIPDTENYKNFEGYNGREFLNKLEPNNLIVSNLYPVNGIISTYMKSFGKIDPNKFYKFSANKVDNTLVYNSTGQGTTNGIFDSITRNIIERIYIFNAERLNIGKYAFGNSSELMANASNLPQVLNMMQVNVERFAKFNRYVNKIFPNIYRISVRPVNSNELEIVVWNEDPKSEREDLLVRLTECGTGLSQVLAILYIVLTAEEPKIILIDEPNSFLHPGASRKLIEILKEYPQHQFILTTHSPTIIAAANPKTIHIVKNHNAQSTVTSLDINEAKGQQSYLSEIGAKLSDVFGADNILWVEGKTEEICFPKIIDKMKGVSLMGTNILAVMNTGDFEGKHAKTILNIYSKLSEGKGLIPPAIGFIFDKEGKNQKEIDDLKKRSRNQIEFSERKMFENYLINAHAICEVLNQNNHENIQLDKIEQWIENKRWDKKYISAKFSNDKKIIEWLIRVDGAKFLSDMFKELTDQRIVYNKVVHSVSLADWLIENDYDNNFDDYKVIFSKLFNIN